jgi:hypothetical protein
MWAEAIFTLTDCENFVSSMTPLELVIDDGLERRLFVDRPTRVELIAEKGIAIEASARLCWSVAGLTVPVTIRIARVLLMPSIETRDGRDALVFAAAARRSGSEMGSSARHRRGSGPRDFVSSGRDLHATRFGRAIRACEFT